MTSRAGGIFDQFAHAPLVKNDQQIIAFLGLCKPSVIPYAYGWNTQTGLLPGDAHQPLSERHQQ